MKKSVKFLSFWLIVCFIMMTFAGCGRILYNDADLSKIVTLGKYKGLEVDMNSDEIQGYIKDFGISDAQDAELYDQLDTGRVEDGDIANIDYEGKRNGVAFEGGTAQDCDLEIGSGSFIEGFEEGLVGAKIGDTVDLKLSFPKEYPNNPDLAGKKVVFTVTVNFVKRLQKPDESFEELGFKSFAAYEKDLEERAVKQYLLEAICANSKIKEYPEEDVNYLYEQLKNQFVNDLKNQGVEFTDYLQYYNMTEEEFKTEFIKEQVKPTMDGQMVLYAILDKENLAFDAEATEKEIEDTIKESGNTTLTLEKVKEMYGEHYFEDLAVSKAVINFVYENAVIKK